jgi:thiazole synthase
LQTPTRSWCSSCNAFGFSYWHKPRLLTRDFLQIIIEQATVPVVVDAGIGAPSHAAEAMEMGADACLVNTAIAVAGNPVEMAIAFKEAVIAGRRAYEAGLGAVGLNMQAQASSPLTSFLQ